MIATEMLELIMGINSLRGIFKAEQFSACVVQHLEHSKSTSNFSVPRRATQLCPGVTPTCAPHGHPQPSYSSSEEGLAAFSDEVLIAHHCRCFPLLKDLECCYINILFFTSEIS